MIDTTKNKRSHPIDDVSTTGSGPGEPVTGGTTPEPPSGQATPKKDGFFKNLFGPGKPNINIRFSPVIGDARQGETRRIVTALDAVPGIKCRIARNVFKIDPKKSVAEQRPRLAAQALQTLSKDRADLLIWGEVSASGQSIDLRFVSPENAAGFCHGIACTGLDLTLPLPLDNTLYPALIAASLTAVTLTGGGPQVGAKKAALLTALGPALEQTIEMAKSPPRFLEPHDRATLQGCLAGAVAKTAQIQNEAALFHLARELYQIALRALAHDVGAPGWAIGQRNFGVILEAIADRNKTQASSKNAEDVIKDYHLAAEAYEVALQSMASGTNPIDTAWVRFRLGQTLFKINAMGGESDILTRSIQAFQAALKNVPVVDLPNNPPPGTSLLQINAQTSLALLRAEILNALAQATQHLGGENRDPKLLEHAVETYQTVLDIRKKDIVPLLWAATQNNLGSALFLLGRLTENQAHFEAAQKAFSAARDAYAKQSQHKRAALAEKHLTYVDDRLAGDKKDTPGIPILPWEEDE